MLGGVWPSDAETVEYHNQLELHIVIGLLLTSYLSTLKPFAIGQYIFHFIVYCCEISVKEEEKFTCTYLNQPYVSEVFLCGF